MAVGCLLALVQLPAGAQDWLFLEFENLSASPGGLVLTGQGGFYLPPGDVDFRAYLYAPYNDPGLPVNPRGGAIFVAGTGPGQATCASAQRDVSFANAYIWTLCYDFAAKHVGLGSGGQPAGSFSVRSSTAAVEYAQQFTWCEPSGPSRFSALYLAYDAQGAPFAEPGRCPGPAWERLEADHWYSAWTTIDLDRNRILEVGILDRTAGTETVHRPTDWFLEGGESGGSGPPASFRLSACGDAPGNVLAFDNLWVIPAPACGACCLDDELCILTTPQDCAARGGEYRSMGVHCDPNPCAGGGPSYDDGVCCMPDGSCNPDVGPGTCGEVGGTWHGYGATCDPNPCPDNDGACCTAYEGCVVTTWFYCVHDLWGEWMGWEDCDPDPCDPAGTGEAAAARPHTEMLSAPLPNPARDGLTYRVSLPRPGRVTIEAADINGRVVASLIDAELGAGEHSFAWNLVDRRNERCANGLYWLRLRALGVQQSRILLVAR